MKTRTRITGRLLSVSESPIGTTLATDAAAGATSITVDDASVFDESGGTLFIGSQVLKYTGYDDDTGIVSLSSALTAAAEADDEVSRWSTLYNEVETAQTAQVAVEGDRDQADTLDVEVSDSLDLPSGERGGDGENCVIELDGDVWTLVSAKGRPSATRSLKFETNDSYVVTAADVTAGTLTMPLSRQPVPESLKLWWRATFQPPTEYTVDESGQTVTMPLGSFVAAGDVIYVHYAYRNGLVPAGASPISFTVVGTAMDHGHNITTVAFPAGAQAGDLFIYACMARVAAANSCSDSRATLWVDQTLPAPSFSFTNTVRIWRGTVSNPSTPLAVNATDLGGVQEDTWGLLVIRPERTTDWAALKVADSGAQAAGSGSVPGLSGVSGAVGVGFSAASIGGTSPHSWVSPWASDVEHGTYGRVSFVTQVASTIGSSPALSAVDVWRGFALGVDLA